MATIRSILIGILILVLGVGLIACATGAAAQRNGNDISAAPAAQASGSNAADTAAPQVASNQKEVQQEPTKPFFKPGLYIPVQKNMGNAERDALFGKWRVKERLNGADVAAAYFYVAMNQPCPADVKWCTYPEYVGRVDQGIAMVLDHKLIRKIEVRADGPVPESMAHGTRIPVVVTVTVEDGTIETFRAPIILQDPGTGFQWSIDTKALSADMRPRMEAYSQRLKQ